MDTVRIRNLTFKYKGRSPVLSGLNATFRNGTLTLITGASGSGKSTLLKLIARLLPVSSIDHGSIHFGSRPLSRILPTELSNYVTMMFQDPNRQFAMRTVKHELIFTLENRRTPPEQIPVRVNRILNDNQLTRFKNRQLSSLSGGEKQRVALAIVTALDPKVILLDEPFTNVDETSRHRIMHKLAHLKSKGKIIVIVDHNLRGYQGITDQLLVLRHRRLVPASFNEFKKQLMGNAYHWSRPKGDRNPVYQLRHFSVGYGRPLILAEAFGFYAHHATLITGPNGSGKSTLFRALLKLIRYRGQIDYQRHDLQKLKNRRYYRNVNLTFQEANDQFLTITTREELQLTVHNAFHSYYSMARINAWLKISGLNRHLNQPVYTLSGGQQRVLQIIESLVNGAPVLLMDEPFRSLDHHLIRFFKGLLKTAVKRDRRTLIVISHQIAPVADLFDYHVELKSKRLNYRRGLYR